MSFADFYTLEITFGHHPLLQSVHKERLKRSYSNVIDDSRFKTKGGYSY